MLSTKRLFITGVVLLIVYVLVSGNTTPPPPQKGGGFRPSRIAFSSGPGLSAKILVCAPSTGTEMKCVRYNAVRDTGGTGWSRILLPGFKGPSSKTKHPMVKTRPTDMWGDVEAFTILSEDTSVIEPN